MLGSVVIACFRVVGAGIGAPMLSERERDTVR